MNQIFLYWRALVSHTFVFVYMRESLNIGINIEEDILKKHVKMKEITAKLLKIITVDFTLLFRAALPTSLGSWVLAYEVANYVVN